MTNLFTIFDPYSSLNHSYNWISLSIPLISFPKQYWLKKSKYLIFILMINNSLYKEINNFSKNKFMNILNLLTLFFLILMMNFFSLFPYIFSASGHMSITLPLALTLWLSIMMFNWFNKPIKCLAHLVPLKTPSMLMMFMMIIESIWNIIRPLTLSIRLTANMIAGHLLLCLLGSCGPSMNTNLILILFITQILLFTLEIAVSIIQSYVFKTLMSLYSNEL